MLHPSRTLYSPAPQFYLVESHSELHPVALCRALRAGRATHGQVWVVRQGSALEARVGPYLVEDGGPGGPSYQDWLLQLHKSVLTGK